MAKYSSYSNIDSGSTEGYTNVEIIAIIASGYIPVADAADLNAIRTTYAGASKRNFAVGTIWETGEINTLGLGDNYIQVADINLDHATLTALYGSTWYSSTNGWPPIGVYSSADFYGDFDGACYKIQNLYIRGSTTIKALFAAVKQNTMQNVRLTNVDVQTTSATIAYTGAFIGMMRDTYLENIYVDGIVSCPNASYIGGIVGSCYKIAASPLNRIVRCKWNGNVTANDNVGGITGFIDTGGCYIRYCKSQGVITGDDCVGGIWGKGLNIYKTYSGVMNYNLSICDVNGNTNVGGIAGSVGTSNGFYNYFDETVCGFNTPGLVNGGYARTTSQLKSATKHSATVDAELVYVGWSEFVWDFGTINDYPELRKRKCNWNPMIADFMPVWDKYVSNPVYVPTYSGVAVEMYPVGVIHTGGKYYLIGKEHENVIGMASSDDGITGWAESTVLNILSVPGTWKAANAGKFEYNTIFYKDGLYYIIFGIVFNDATSGIGYATSATVNSGYVINPTMIFDPDNNNTLTELGYSFNYFTAPDWTRIGDTYHWYLCAIYQGYYCLIRGESTTVDWLNITWKEIFMYGGDFEYFFGDKEGMVLQTPRVYYYDGYYYMTFTAGANVGMAGQRYIYVARSTDPTKFNIANWQTTPIVVTDGDDSWSEARVYCHDILKVNDDYRLTPELIDGKIRMYYSGHSFDDYGPPKLTGVPGLATLTV